MRAATWILIGGVMTCAGLYYSTALPAELRTSTLTILAAICIATGSILHNIENRP